MTRIAIALFLTVGFVSGCGSATAEHDHAATTAEAQADTAAAATDAAPTAPAPTADTGSCPGGPGGSCCGGGTGSCSQMAETPDGEGGCACQRRARLIEKARQQAASE